jgi:hypothetical protein
VRIPVMVTQDPLPLTAEPVAVNLINGPRNVKQVAATVA